MHDCAGWPGSIVVAKAYHFRFQQDKSNNCNGVLKNYLYSYFTKKMIYNVYIIQLTMLMSVIVLGTRVESIKTVKTSICWRIIPVTKTQVPPEIT